MEDEWNNTVEFDYNDAFSQVPFSDVIGQFYCTNLLRKRDLMTCGAYRGVKLLEHAMKIGERVLERRIRMDDVPFDLCQERAQ